MKYVTTDGFEEYLGDKVDDWLTSHEDEEENLLAGCESRLLAYIIPNTPRCDEQKAAFARAVYAQLAYETSEKNAQLDDMPDGMTGFTVNGFSATFGNTGLGDRASSVGLCREARSELLLAGLLFRGVQCTC